jgi:hypothetical protein
MYIALEYIEHLYILKIIKFSLEIKNNFIDEESLDIVKSSSKLIHHSKILLPFFHFFLFIANLISVKIYLNHRISVTEYS